LFCLDCKYRFTDAQKKRVSIVSLSVKDITDKTKQCRNEFNRLEAVDEILEFNVTSAVIKQKIFKAE